MSGIQDPPTFATLASQTLCKPFPCPPFPGPSAGSQESSTSNAEISIEEDTEAALALRNAIGDLVVADLLGETAAERVA